MDSLPRGIMYPELGCAVVLAAMVQLKTSLQLLRGFVQPVRTTVSVAD
jgi:hypothetical protein